MSEPGTKERILDAAEHLFARQGYPGASLREITALAGVNLAAVNYHFGSKENLVEAVIERRIVPLNQVRLDRLARVKTEARRQNRLPRVADILGAFIEPTLRFLEESPGGRDFSFIVARAQTDPDTTIRNFFFGLVFPLFREFFDALCAALPGRPKNQVFMRLRFVLGAMSHVIMTRMHAETVVGRLLEDCRECSGDELLAELLPFVTRGMEDG
jgi:AcrR family transcriptional regulator